MALFLGVMSGTSLDGIDVCLVDFDQALPTLHAYTTVPYQASTQAKLSALLEEPHESSLQQLGELDMILAHEYADACLALISQAQCRTQDIKAMGCHGQTVFHHPDGSHPFSMQIGNGQLMAARTGIDCITDFRTADLIAGGQGAPLAPLFHATVLSHPCEARAVVNIGGMSNVSLLIPNQPTTGFDTGPGNVLINTWCQLHTQQPYDASGAWAASGAVCETTLSRWLSQPYFERRGAKSTGRELFGQAWLKQHANPDLCPADMQATLTALTARSISNALKRVALDTVLLAGGGRHNTELVRILQSDLPHHIQLKAVDSVGLHGDQLEAMTMAWLAQARIEHRPLPLTSITGAKRHSLLGVIHPAPPPKAIHL